MKIFFVIFTAVFFAEMADKMQLVGIGMASKSAKPLGLYFSARDLHIHDHYSCFGYNRAQPLGKYIKPEIIKYCKTALFRILGILMLFNKL